MNFNLGTNIPNNVPGFNNSINHNNYYTTNNDLNQYKYSNNIAIQNNYINENRNTNQQRINKSKKNIPNNDERLNICLNLLGLKKYIVNFQKKGINFDDFLSLSNKDFTILKIPRNIQEIIQNFIISYLNFGSLYTSEEIIQFFKKRKMKNNNQSNMNRASQGPKYQSVNKNRNNMMGNNNQKEFGTRLNSNNNRNQSDRPRSQNNNQINYDYLEFNDGYRTNFNFHHQDLINEQKMNAYNNYNQELMGSTNTKNRIKNNFAKRVKNNAIRSSNMKNNLNRKNNFNKQNSNNNSNIISISSSFNNNYNKYIGPSIDNMSHLAVGENYSNIDNMIKMSQFRDKNNDNLNYLKQNLSKEKQMKARNNRKMNTQKDNTNNILQQMDNIIKKDKLRKENNKYIVTQSNNFNCNQENRSFGGGSRGYHSDGYLNEQKKIQQYNNLINSKVSQCRNNTNNNSQKPNHNKNLYNNLKQNTDNNINNNNYLNGYEINSYYTGDTSHLDSLRRDLNIGPDIKRIKGKNGKIYYSKANKLKKINEEQTKKIEQLLAYGGGSASAIPKAPIDYSNKLFNTRGNSFKRNNAMLNNNCESNNFNQELLNSVNNNNSKSNLSSHTHGQTNYINPFNIDINNPINNIDQQLLLRHKKKNKNRVIKDAFSPSINKFNKQKNMITKVNMPQKNIPSSKSNKARIYNNFNTYINNRGNISTNLYDNNNILFDENLNTIQNINNSRGSSNYGPVQIKTNQNVYSNNNMRNAMIQNNNNNVNVRRNNFMNQRQNNNNQMNNYKKNSLRKNSSVENKKKNNNNMYPIPNYYINTFIDFNNDTNNKNQRKTNVRSFDVAKEPLHIGVYSGIHNINNNNINNININNINYDSTDYFKRFNNFRDLNMEMNYRTQKNFYNPNNLLNNDEIFFDEII